VALPKLLWAGLVICDLSISMDLNVKNEWSAIAMGQIKIMAMFLDAPFLLSFLSMWIPDY